MNNETLTEDLHMRKVCVRNDRKNNCVDLLDIIVNEQDFFNSVITGDIWHNVSSLRPKKARVHKSFIKLSLIYLLAEGERLGRCVAAQGNYFEITFMFEKIKTLVIIKTASLLLCHTMHNLVN